MEFAIQKLEIIKEWIKRHPLIVIFFIAFFIYVVVGLYIIYDDTLLVNTSVGAIYSYDAGFRFNSLYKFKNHCNTDVHPLTSILQPVIGFIWSLVRNNKTTLIISQSIVASASSCLFYSCLNKFRFSEGLKILLLAIFTLSYSNLIAVSIPELYIYNGLIQLLFITYILFVTNNKDKKLSIVHLFIIAMLNCLSFAIHLSNILPCLICVSYVLINKNGKVYQNFFLNLLKISILTIVLITGFTLLEKSAFGGKTFLHTYETHSKHGYIRFFNKMKNIDRITYTFKGNFIQPFYSMKNEISRKEQVNPKFKNLSGYKTKTIYFSKNQNIGHYLPFLLFFFLPLVYAIKNKKDFRYKGLVIFLSSILFIHCIYNGFFEVQSAFLYSQNSFCFLTLLIALLYSYVPKNIAIPACAAFLAYQIPTNLQALHFIQKFVSQTAKQHHSVGTWMLWSLIFCIGLGIIGFAVSKLIKKEIFELPLEKKYLLFTSLYLGYTIIFLIFVSLSRGSLL